MKKTELEQYIGSFVHIKLFDGTDMKGFLYKTGTDRYKNDASLYYKQNFYVLENECNRYDYSIIFRSSHITKFELLERLEQGKTDENFGIDMESRE